MPVCVGIFGDLSGYTAYGDSLEKRHGSPYGFFGKNVFLGYFWCFFGAFRDKYKLGYGIT